MNAQLLISFALTFTGCTFLFLRSDGSRASRLLATFYLIWCINFSLRLLGPLLGTYNTVQGVFLSPFHLILGIPLVTLLILYFLEIVRPGWINWKRGALILLPWFVLSAAYPVGMLLLGEGYIELYSFGDFAAHSAVFNVWYRVVLFAMLYAYLFIFLYYINRYKYYYVKWCDDNYTSSRHIEITWLRTLSNALLLLMILFGGILFNLGNFFIIAHQFVIQFIILYGLYNGLYHQNPYTEVFFAETLNEDEALQLYDAKQPVTEKEDSLFSERLPQYVQVIEAWMANHQPYLNCELKLMDVTHTLQLNRSYLSRIFNEGFGCSFSQFIQRYRIEEAKKRLRANRENAIKDIAFQCGFASTTTFHTAFQKETGMTPSQYRLSDDEAS